MTAKMASEILGIGESAVLARIKKGKIRASRIMVSKKRYRYDIPMSEINRVLDIKRLRREAWEIIIDLRDDGASFEEIGKLVSEKAKWSYQCGNMAYHNGKISDPVGFFDRLKESGK